MLVVALEREWVWARVRNPDIFGVIDITATYLALHHRQRARSNITLPPLPTTTLIPHGDLHAPPLVCSTGDFNVDKWKPLATIALDAAYEATLWR